MLRPTSAYDFSAPHLSPLDAGGGHSAPLTLRVQFDRDPSEWPVRVLYPRAFSTLGTAVPPGQTVTATLTVADTLSVMLRARAHPATADNTQWFSIMDGDDEILPVLARLAQ